MSSLQEIFERFSPFASAYYRMDGVTFALVRSLSPTAYHDDLHDTNSPPPQRFVVVLLQGPQAGEFVGTQSELVTLLASAHPPIPTQRGWQIGDPPPDEPE